MPQGPRSFDSKSLRTRMRRSSTKLRVAWGDGETVGENGGKTWENHLFCFFDLFGSFCS